MYTPPSTQDSEFKAYIDSIASRQYEIIPPVATSGLPPLEKLDIEGYDPLQLHFRPNEAQRLSQRVQAIRGPRYLLTHIQHRLKYNPPSQLVPVPSPPYSSSSSTSTPRKREMLFPVISRRRASEIGSDSTSLYPVQSTVQSFFSRLKRRTSLKKSSTPGLPDISPPTPTSLSPPSSILTSPSTSLSTTTTNSRWRRKHSKKYIANMGVLASTNTPFEVLIDPTSSHSYIDPNAFWGTVSPHLQASQFDVIATPSYNPESPFNRVCITISFVPRVSDIDGMAAKRSSTTFTREALMMVNRTSSMKRTMHKYAPAPRQNQFQLGTAGIDVFGYGPLPGYHSRTQSQNTQYSDTNLAGHIKPELKNMETKRFEEKWKVYSRDLIQFAYLAPYNCILGRDWIDKLDQMVDLIGEQENVFVQETVRMSFEF